jgi:hypothetical protein
MPTYRFTGWLRHAANLALGRARMECYTSKVKLLGLLGLTWVMVSVSYFCSTLPDLTARVVGWIGVSFFGLGFIALPVMFLRAGPQVVINDEGIEDRRLKIDIIRWEDIRSLSIGSVNSAKFLCVEVADPGRYLSRLPRWRRSLTAANEALGFPALTISLSGLSPGLKEVWAYLQARDTMLTGGGAQRVDSLCACLTRRLFVSGQTARSSELAGLTCRRLRSSRRVMDHSPPMCSGFCTGLTAVAPFHRVPLARANCLSDFRRYRDSTIAPLLTRCPPCQTGDSYVGREQHVADGQFTIDQIRARPSCELTLTEWA